MMLIGERDKSMFNPSKTACPYTEKCESFKIMVKSERWMEKALSQLWRSGAERLSKEDGGYTSENLYDKLSRVRRVKTRCYNRSHRCLRYWQFEKTGKSSALNELYKSQILAESGQNARAKVFE